MKDASIDQVDAPLSGGRCGAWRNVARATFRTPLFLLTHLVRIRSVTRAHATVQRISESPPARPAGDHLQTIDDGVGPVVLRRYEIQLDGPSADADELITAFRAEPNRIAATSVAAFMVGDQAARDLEIGDRLLVELAGPRNGPVEVIEASRSSVVMATLDGHMEAGLIRFDVIDTGADVASSRIFRITSWARAADRPFRFLHLTVPVGREIQTAMWVAMCRRAADSIGGGQRRVHVTTEVCEVAS